MQPAAWRLTMVRCVCAAWLAVLWAVPPSAAASGSGPASAEGASVFSGSVWNAVWALAIFAVLLLLLGRFAWKPVVQMLQDRETRVANTIAEAEKRRTEAMDLLAEYRRQLDQAQAEAQRLMQQTQLEADKLRRSVIDQARVEAEEAQARAVKQIESSKNEALSAIFGEAAAISTRIAGRILQREIRPEDHQRLVEQTLAELQVTQPGNR